MNDQPNRLLAVAFHEAGHALAAICFGASVISVSIFDGRDSDGNMGRTCHNGKINSLVQRVAFYLAGLEAEARINLGATLPTGDQAHIDSLLEPYSRIERERYLADADREAKHVVDHYWRKIEAIANQLREQRELSGEKVHDIALIA